MKQNNKYFKLLRKALCGDFLEEEVAKEINKSVGSVSQRFNRKQEFTISEAYAILKLINEPFSKIEIYFPPEEVNSLDQ